jgi:hypothetical protein
MAIWNKNKRGCTLWQTFYQVIFDIGFVVQIKPLILQGGTLERLLNDNMINVRP